MEDHVRIFDTTLRDGEQAPGCTMTKDEKLEVARQLARLKVDIIEAGFPAASPGDWDAVNAIAQELGSADGPVICGLARANKDDIDKCWSAIEPAVNKRIHTFMSTSDIHLEHQFRKSRGEALELIGEMVTYARSLCDDVEYSPEDAGRADPEYLFETLEAVIDAGATVVNIPDTTGYTLPNEFGALIAAIRANVRNVDQALISVHCHNDLGLSTANSVAAVLNGARRVECTINGIGERAGNASLEEVVMILRTRERSLGLRTGIDTTRLADVSALVSRHTGVPVQPNKAVVGANAFAHASGIHQDGVLKDKLTYEIMRPEDVGMGESRIVLSPRSGRHAFQFRLAELGYHLPDAAFSHAWEQFLQLADRKKDILDKDLEDIVRSTQSLAAASPPPLAEALASSPPPLAGEGRVGAIR